MANYIHMRVKAGGAVHLGYPEGYLICGAGHSALDRSRRSPKARPTDDPVTCRRCLAMSAGQANEPLYAVRAIYPDNPGANAAEHLTAAEIAARWPFLAPLLAEPDFTSLEAVFDLARIHVARDTPSVHDLGYDAGFIGVWPDENPYAQDTPEHRKWARGHTDGVADAHRLKEMGLY